MCVKYLSHLVFNQNHRISFPYTTHFVFAIIDSYYICTCSLDSKGKNGTMKGYTLQTSSGNITFSMMFYIGIGDTGTYTYGDKSKFPIFPCRMGRAGL